MAIKAIEICRVHRRNQGFYHPTYNPNGSKLASDGLPWYSTTVSFTSIADCFTDSKLLAASGYIGTVSGRPDGLFYDQVHEGDILDLRMSSQKVQDYNRLIDREFNKLVAGTYRGAEGEWNVLDTFTTATTNDNYYSDSYWFSGTYIDTGAHGFFTKYGQHYNNAIMGTHTIFAIINGVPFKVTLFESNTRSYIQKEYGVKTNFTGSITNGDSVVFVVAVRSTRTKSNTLTHTDIIGSPANYPTAWKTSGVSGVPLIVAEDGTSMLPTGALATFKLSRKANATPLQVLKSTDSGATWTALTVTTHYTFNITTNAITFTAGNIPLTADLIRVTYQTHTVMATATTNSEVVASGRAIAMNGVANGHLGYSLIGKVMTASTSPYVQDGYGAWGYRIDPTNMKFSTTSTEAPMHTAFTLGGMALGVPAVKTGMYITRSNGKARLILVFKEIKHNGTSVGDDAKFNIVDNVSTTTDNNAQTVLIGQKYVDIPFFIGASE